MVTLCCSGHCISFHHVDKIITIVSLVHQLSQASKKYSFTCHELTNLNLICFLSEMQHCENKDHTFSPPSPSQRQAQNEEGVHSLVGGSVFTDAPLGN
jgi:hypothetical protein